jgi:glycerol-3-phosphate dehydrogenase subunit C
MAESIGLRIQDPKFWDPSELRGEVDRIFDICDSCRLCFKFCGSFPRLFEAIDRRTESNRARHLAEHPELVEAADRRRAAVAASSPQPHEEGVEAAEAFGDELPELAASARDISNDEIDEVVDLCFQCKLCYPNCPYTPPHDYAVDFPRLLLRWKAQRARREGTPPALRVLRNPRLVGRLSSVAPRLARLGMSNRFARWGLEKVLGVHRRKRLPPIPRETFARWWRTRPATSAADGTGAADVSGATSAGTVDLPLRVVLFSTCLVDYHDPTAGQAAVRVLEHNGVEVAWPAGQRCCGMPRLDGGEVEAAASQVRDNVALLHPWVARGYAVVVPSPSCSLMMREEAAQLVDTAAAHEVASATYDLCDYLFRLSRAGRIKKEFARRLGPMKYHVPCHIRVQQIGYRGRDVLRWVSESVDLVQECSGHDGTWSMLRENFDDSLRWGRKCFEGMIPAAGETCAGACTDCALAAVQIGQGAGITAVHPVVALAYAYGFDVGEAASHLVRVGR